jgi:hypothetical protein
VPSVVDNDIEQAACRGFGSELGEEDGVCLIADENTCVGGFVLVLLGALRIVLDEVEVDEWQIFEPSVVRRPGAIILRAVLV